jgi:hypothetical protein
MLNSQTILEDEIEIIAGGNEQLTSKKTILSDNTRAWRFVLPASFLIAVFFFYWIQFVKVFFTIDHADRIVGIPAIYEPLTKMQSLSEAIHRMTFDIFDQDTVSFAIGQDKLKMRETIQTYTDALEEINVLLAPQLASKDNPIFIYWRKGGCFKPTQQECDDAVYDPTVGFNKALATSGLESQILTFIDSANKFLNEQQYVNGTNAKMFKLIGYLNEAFYTDFDVIVREFNNYSYRSFIIATAALFGLATCVLTAFGFMYYIGFMTTPKKYSNKNKLLVALVYSVDPADRAKTYELNTFVESSGASIN